MLSIITEFSTKIRNVSINIAVRINPEGKFGTWLESHSPKFRNYLKEQRQLKEQKERSERDQAIKEASESRAYMLRSILHNCPADHLLALKFPCGTYSDRMILEEVPYLVRFASDPENPYAYLFDAGFIIIDPDKYGRDPKKIAAVTVKPVEWILQFHPRYSAWKYYPKNSQ